MSVKVATKFSDLKFEAPNGAEIIAFHESVDASMSMIAAQAKAAAQAAGVEDAAILELKGKEFWSALAKGKELFMEPE